MLFDIDQLGFVGRNVEIGEFVKITSPENVIIDDNARIDDFTLICGGQGIRIGKYVHISSFCSVTGGGSLEMGDFSGFAAGCRIITGSDDYSGKCMTNPCVPEEFRQFAQKSRVIIKKHAILGTNTIVLPGLTIGEGAATGTQTVVNKDLKDWTIYLGSPARMVRPREKQTIPRMEKELRKKYHVCE